MVDVNIKGVLYGSEQAHLGRPECLPLAYPPAHDLSGIPLSS